MKYVVTGGSGSLGRAVITELVEHGHEVLSLDRAPHPGGHRPSWTVDLTAPESLYPACRGAAGVVHLAAWPAPNMTSDSETFNTNVAITYNVLQAASDMGVPRVVLASSNAAYGYVYGAAEAVPDYLPLDEAHPCRPTDPYGLSKVVGERIAAGFAAGGEMTIASLRLAGVVFDPQFRLLKERMADPGARRSGGWAYIDARDAASSFRLALETELDGHQVFNVAAPTTSMREPTADLIRAHYPAVTDIRPGSDPRWSGLDSSRAEKELGFRAQYRWEDVDGA